MMKKSGIIARFLAKAGAWHGRGGFEYQLAVKGLFVVILSVGGLSVSPRGSFTPLRPFRLYVPFFDCNSV